MKIIIAEKPSVGRTYAQVLGVHNKEDGYMESDEWIVTWSVGHLVTLCYPEDYDPELKHWSMDTLPFLPETYHYRVIDDVRKQFEIVKKLYHRDDVSAIYYAGDSGREGLYIQMLIRAQAGTKAGIEEKVVWIDTQTDEEVLRGIREAKPLSTKFYQDLMQAGYMRAIADSATDKNSIIDKVCINYREYDTELTSLFFDFPVKADKNLLLEAYAHIQKACNGDTVARLINPVLTKNREEEKELEGETLDTFFSEEENEVYEGSYKNFLESFNGRELETGICRLMNSKMDENWIKGSLLDFIW